jgi:HEPN domain-containing protein
MKKEEHEKTLQEHLRNLSQSIDQGIEENQRNIGYNVSQGSVELFALYMHHLNLVEGSGDQWDHRIFKSKNLVERKIPPQFPHREKILELMESIEKERIPFCYGKRKPQVQIEKIILVFQELRKIIEPELQHDH